MKVLKEICLFSGAEFVLYTGTDFLVKTKEDVRLLGMDGKVKARRALPVYVSKIIRGRDGTFLLLPSLFAKEAYHMSGDLKDLETIPLPTDSESYLRDGCFLVDGSFLLLAEEKTGSYLLHCRKDGGVSFLFRGDGHRWTGIRFSEFFKDPAVPYCPSFGERECPFGRCASGFLSSQRNRTYSQATGLSYRQGRQDREICRTPSLTRPPILSLSDAARKSRGPLSLLDQGFFPPGLSNRNEKRDRRPLFRREVRLSPKRIGYRLLRFCREGQAFWAKEQVLMSSVPSLAAMVSASLRRKVPSPFPR